MAIIERAVLEPSANAGPAGNGAHANADRWQVNGRGTVVGFDRFGHAIVRQGWKTVDQVAAELKAKYPEPVTDVPRGVDIIRADRDAR